jgi:O-methyltransferase domain/Dimerisation domain
MLQPENQQTSRSVPPQVEIMQMATGYWVSQSLYAAAKLGIADLLKDGPKSYDELATATAVKARPLYRLLRGLASVGVFSETEPGYFTLTPLAACLQTDITGSMRAVVTIFGEEEYQAWGDILYSLRTGGSAFEHIYKMPLYQYHAQKPEQGKTFNEAMTNISLSEDFEIATSYDFSGINKLVDVGGGHGSLIASILKANPEMQGILFDLPTVIAGAKSLIEAEGVENRCSLIAGDFFDSVPSAGNAYILKHIIHNWEDESARAILKNCHRAMIENDKLLVIEEVIPLGNEPSFSKLFDLTMMVLFPGACERTEVEYRALFEACGFHLNKIYPTQAGTSVIEGIRV